MNQIGLENKRDWLLMGITFLCELMAYVLAVVCRYIVLNPFYSNQDRFFDFYKLFALIVVLARMILFLLREQKKEKEPIWRQDLLNIVVTAFQQHLLLLVILVLFLYFTGWSTRVSRTVMGLLIIFGIALDCLSRMLYKKYHLKKYGKYEKILSVLVFAEENERNLITYNLNTFGYRNESRYLFQPLQVQEFIDVLKWNGKLPEKAFDLIYLSGKAESILSSNQRKTIEAAGIPMCSELIFKDKPVSMDQIRCSGAYAAVRESFMIQKQEVLGVTFTASGKADTARYLMEHLDELRGKYICFSNVHTTVMAHDDATYKNVLNHSAFTMPDGNPIAKKLLEQGFAEAERVAGPDFMDTMFRLSAGTEHTHYFYGSTEETIEKLKKALQEKYPSIKIVGMYSPPFRALSEEEDHQVIRTINDSKADFIWIGLGAPKQEKWMYDHKDKLNGLMFGVGAGFDFHAGTVKRAPILIQKVGLEWLYRLLQDPKRLFKRYVVTNTKFLVYTLFR